MDGLSIKSIKKITTYNQIPLDQELKFFMNSSKMAILFLFCFIIIFVYYFKRNQENLQNK